MTNYSPLLAIFALAPKLRRASNRAVSIYLPARSEGYDARFYDIEFRDLLHRYGDRLSPKDRELMEYEMRRLRHYVNPTLLVIDEVGYLSYSNRHADLLFELSDELWIHDAFRSLWRTVR